MNGKYRIDYLVILAVMKQFGLSEDDINSNIMQVNNDLLDGLPCCVDDVKFKPLYGSTFSVARTEYKQKKVWRSISAMNIARALDRHAAGWDVDEHICRVISHDLLEGDVIEFRGLKLKPDNKGGFRIYDDRDKVQRPFEFA